MNKASDATTRSLVSPVALRGTTGRVAYWLVWVGLLLLTLTTLLPLYWMVSGALKTPVELLRVPPSWLPADPQWGNYPLAWGRLRYSVYFTNTLLIALGGWVLQITVSSMAAFSLAKLRPAFGRAVLFVLLATLMVPPAAYLIPQYLTIVRVPLLGWSLLDSWWGVWLPGAASAFNIFVLKSFFESIPDELTDAARIDGASAWGLFARIVLPLSTPALAVVSIFSLIGAWKDFFWPYLVLSDADKQPIMVALFRLANRAQEPLNLLVAALAIASLPPIIIFLVFQRQIIRGIVLTGIKG
jgi:multiple sugar transport system permease protein